MQREAWVIGKTVGELPYLEYGHGYDRLGAAKFTFLDTGVVLKVVDSTVVNYKVQLSKNRHAYLPKQYFRADTTLRQLPYYLSGSILVNGDEQFDYISISLDEKLPYAALQQISPSRIAVDIFGATSNTNWITQRSSALEVRNIYHEQVDDDILRVTIELNHQQHWGHTAYYQDKKLVIKVKRQPSGLELKDLKIALDAGHGGTNTGARGVKTGIEEKKYTLLITKELERYLRAEGAQVFMTRDRDISLGMSERIEMLDKYDPHLMISIHLNSSSKDSIRGVSTYYRYIGFRPLTQHILTTMVQLGMVEFGNVGSFNFALSGPTSYPNCLLEVAFLSNKEDEKLILDPEFHKAVACQVVEGIKSWLRACKNDVPQSSGGNASPR